MRSIAAVRRKVDDALPKLVAALRSEMAHSGVKKKDVGKVKKKKVSSSRGQERQWCSKPLAFRAILNC